MEGIVKDYLLASDFDLTLSFNDSGLVLSELVGIPAKDFERKNSKEWLNAFPCGEIPGSLAAIADDRRQA